jgi:hypothetical protein
VCRSLGAIEGARELSVVTAAKPGSVDLENTPNLTATVTFTPSRGMLRIAGPQHIFLDRISIMDHHGNRYALLVISSWAYSTHDSGFHNNGSPVTLNS